MAAATPVVACTVGVTCLDGTASPSSSSSEPLPIEDCGLEFTVYDECVHRLPDADRTLVLTRTVLGIAETVPTGDAIDEVVVHVGPHHTVYVPWAKAEEEGARPRHQCHVESPDLTFGMAEVHMARIQAPIRPAPEGKDEAVKEAVRAFETEICAELERFLSRDDVCEFFAGIVAQNGDNDDLLDTYILEFLNRVEGEDRDVFLDIYNRHREAILTARRDLKASDTTPLSYRHLTLMIELYDARHLTLTDASPEAPGVDAEVLVDFPTSGLQERIAALGYHKGLEGDVFQDRANTALISDQTLSLSHVLTDEEHHFARRALPRVRASLCREYLYEGEPYLMACSFLVAAHDRALEPVNHFEIRRKLAGSACPWPESVVYAVPWTTLLKVFGMASDEAMLGPRAMQLSAFKHATARCEAHADAPRSETWDSGDVHAYPLVARHELEGTSMHAGSTRMNLVRMARSRVPGWKPPKAEGAEAEEEEDTRPTVSYVRDLHSLVLTSIGVRNVIEDRISSAQ